MDLNIILSRIREIVFVPFENPELIPSIVPLLLGFVVIELYFGRYKSEEMGWNSAVSNTTILISTSLMLFYSMYMTNIFAINKIIVALTIFGVGAVILLFDFFHILPAKIAFSISSPFVIYFLTYSAISVFYAKIPLNFDSLIAFSCLFFIVLILVKFVQHYVKE